MLRNGQEMIIIISHRVCFDYVVGSPTALIHRGLQSHGWTGNQLDGENQNTKLL